MKKLIVVCLLLASLHARADMVIALKVEQPEQSMEMTMKIKGDKIRTDATPQVSTIMDTATGDMITIMRAQKNYMKISAEKTKAMMEQMKKCRDSRTRALRRPPRRKWRTRVKRKR